MFLGAFVDLGVSFSDLREGLKSLDIKGFDLRKEESKRHSIACTKVHVDVEDIPHPHRHVGDLLEIIDRADLPQRVKERSARVLIKLAQAESAAHRAPIEKVHLHEVGGLDCLVDVVGTCLCLEQIHVHEIVTAPVSVGSGLVGCAHGRMPVPAPGTLAILEGIPLRRTSHNGEMTTPTGAALISTLAIATWEPFSFVSDKVGYGAGTKDKQDIANMLRLVLGRTNSRFLQDLRNGAGMKAKVPPTQLNIAAESGGTEASGRPEETHHHHH